LYKLTHHPITKIKKTFFYRYFPNGSNPFSISTSFFLIVFASTHPIAPKETATRDWQQKVAIFFWQEQDKNKKSRNLSNATLDQKKMMLTCSNFPSGPIYN